MHRRRLAQSTIGDVHRDFKTETQIGEGRCGPLHRSTPWVVDRIEPPPPESRRLAAWLYCNICANTNQARIPSLPSGKPALAGLRRHLEQCRLGTRCSRLTQSLGLLLTVQTRTLNLKYLPNRELSRQIPICSAPARSLQFEVLEFQIPYTSIQH